MAGISPGRQEEFRGERRTDGKAGVQTETHVSIERRLLIEEGELHRHAALRERVGQVERDAKRIEIRWHTIRWHVKSQRISPDLWRVKVKKHGGIRGCLP